MEYHDRPLHPTLLRAVLLLLFLLPAVSATAQVCTGDLELPTQAAVDAFACSEITGTLLIGDSSSDVSSDIDDLSPMVGLTSVDGDLWIVVNHALTSLSGLEGLTSVGGSVNIVLNNGLTSLSGLDGLAAIGGNLRIDGNQALTSLSGLESLTSVDGAIEIDRNASLASLEGLHNLSTGTDRLRITQNPSLTSIEALANLTALSDEVRISDNLALTTLDGLENITSVGQSLTIDGNDALTACACGLGGLISGGAFTGVQADVSITNGTDGFCTNAQEVLDTPCFDCAGDVILNAQADVDVFASQACPSIAGALVIAPGGGTGDPVTDLSDLGALASVRGELSIANNTALASLTGLDALASVGGSLNIIQNDAFTDLTGLGGLASVDGPVNIDNNAALASLTGLDALESIGDRLSISGLASLASLTGLGALTSVGDLVRIENNAALTSLTGLDALTSVGGNLFINLNASLTSLAGLESLTALGGNLFISSNSALASLGGPSNLTAIGADLVLSDNDALPSLNGLESITSVGGNLFITSNAGLSDCACGLAGLTSGGTFSGVAGSVSITSNAPGGFCTSPQVVLDDGCSVDASVAITLTPKNPPIVIHPLGGLFRFSYALSNTSSDTQSTQAWLTLTRPDGSEQRQVGPLNVNLSPGQTKTWRIFVLVPFFADPGTYTYTGYAGTFPDEVLSTSSFSFEKQAHGGNKAPSGEPVAAWSLVDEASGRELLNEQAVGAEADQVPESYVLQQNYPNPFNPSTEIGFALPDAAQVRLVVYDMLGREVARLVEGPMAAGTHMVRFEAGSLPSGTYLYRIDAGAFSQVRMMQLVK